MKRNHPTSPLPYDSSFLGFQHFSSIPFSADTIMHSPAPTCGADAAGSQASACINPMLPDHDSFSCPTIPVPHGLTRLRSSSWHSREQHWSCWFASCAPQSLCCSQGVFPHGIHLLCLAATRCPSMCPELLAPSQPHSFSLRLPHPGSLSRDASRAMTATRPDVLSNTRNTWVIGTTTKCSRALATCSTVVEEFQKPLLSAADGLNLIKFCLIHYNVLMMMRLA